MSRRWASAARLLAAAGAAVLFAPLVGGQAPGPRFEVSFSSGARAEAVTGRVYVAVSRTADRQTPIQQASPTGVPLFSRAVEGLAPGATIVLSATDPGSPIATLRDLPAGEYFVQPVVNVYTRFARTDGHTVWLHMDQWEGQDWKDSPGNLYGDPVKVGIDPASTSPIRLIADKVHPPVQVPADTELVKRIKIQSQILTKWWGHPIFLGAVVLLPKGYDQHPGVSYPIVYSQGHFSLDAPGGYGRDQTFTTYWNADGTPRLIYVTP